MSKVCLGCECNYFEFIQKFYRDNEASIAYLRDHGVLPLEVNCPRCKKPCHYRAERHTWYCGAYTKIPKTKRRKQCCYSASDFNGSFLSGARIEPYKVMCFVNHFLSRHWDYQTVSQCLGISTGTRSTWQKYCSEVTEHWLDNQEPIGGPDIVVDIDETLFGKMKYEKGKSLSQIWVFGGIERDSKNYFIVPLEEPLSQNLMSLIQKYIRPGSVIVSNRWNAYSSINDYDYVHQVINHSGDSTDEENAEAHTQSIELLWHDIKEFTLAPGNRPQFYKQYLARLLFVQQHTFSNVNHYFFREVARMYPPDFETDETEETPSNSCSDVMKEPDDHENKESEVSD
ncbi:uncharacterized protein LOC125038837 [Penaeus chinensis]|uniref:uncharacterized protein LOC125038837 n=1 Tax=Penaeus chinensis TaxID=139456 RepID=UPI001FB63C24|nr:uncharacterized protein LOC125038837 [Penaeus chinensis]